METFEREMPGPEKWSVFKNYENFYSACRVGAVVRIHGKTIENGKLANDLSRFVDARPHKITDRYANMNVYDGGKVVAYFRLDQKNISQFQIEIIQK